MNQPTTVREALIVEALGDVALLLDRVDSLTSSMEVGRLALAHAIPARTMAALASVPAQVTLAMVRP